MTKGIVPVKAKIANDFGTIIQVMKNLKNRIKPPKEDYDPMEFLKKILQKQITEELKLEDMPETFRGAHTTRGEGFTRKHVPYLANGKIVAQLISSIVTS